MADLFDYLHWRGDLSFTQSPLNDIDALIFSALSYISFGGSVEASPHIPISLANATEIFYDLPDHESRVRVKTDLRLLTAAASTKRFGSAMLVQYRDLLVQAEETQFAALTFLLDDHSAFLAFRGTDSSLVGWKEDFNMSFLEEIPSQRLAVEYTEEIGTKYIMPMHLGGHSKGGNLAVYASVRSRPGIRRRIVNVYNNDGPGFTDHLMNDPAYKEMTPQIQTIVPQSSVIGMLLEHEEPYTIIRSKNIGLLQHELYSWELHGPAFIPVEEITAESRFLNQTIRNWLSGMTIQQRNEVVDTVFDLLSTGDVKNVFDIIQPKNIRNYLRALSRDGKTRRILSDELLSLIEAARMTQLQLEAAHDEQTP